MKNPPWASRVCYKYAGFLWETSVCWSPCPDPTCSFFFYFFFFFFVFFSLLEKIMTIVQSKNSLLCLISKDWELNFENRARTKLKWSYMHGITEVGSLTKGDSSASQSTFWSAPAINQTMTPNMLTACEDFRWGKNTQNCL